MRKMTGTERGAMFELVLLRDGPYCFVGREKLTRENLFLVPWDTDATSRDPENWKLVCSQTNTLVNRLARRRMRNGSISISYRVCETAVGPEKEPPPNTSLEFLKNLTNEPKFNHWLFTQVYLREKIPYKEVLDGGAFVGRITQKTSREYTDKQTSPQGLYMIVKEGEERFVCLKPQWETFRRVIEERRTLERQAKNWREEMLSDLPISTRKSRRKKEGPGPHRSETQSPEIPT